MSIILIGCSSRGPVLPPTVTIEEQSVLSQSSPILDTRCSRCHDLGRAYAVIDDPLQWVRTVAAMSEKDPEWLSGDALRAVIRYRQRHQDYVQRLFHDNCGACHSWDELRSMKKSASQWKTTVKYMARRCHEGMVSHEQEAISYALAVP